MQTQPTLTNDRDHEISEAAPQPSTRPPAAADQFLPPPVIAPPQPPDPTGRRWLWILAGAGIVAIAIVISLLLLGTWVAQRPIIDDDLNRGDGPFIAETDPLVDLRYEDGGYAMALAPVENGQRQIARSFWGMTRRGVDLRVSYEVRDGPDPSEWWIGLGCVGSGGTYWFLTAGDGNNAIVLESGTGLEVLAELEDPERIPLEGRLELQCDKGSGAAPTEIVAERDGTAVLRASHASGYGSYAAIGIIAGTNLEAELNVLWDDVYVAGRTGSTD